jgi:class 3 adenylate cyclase/tetratricopeptide (TPR) repeat protein
MHCPRCGLSNPEGMNFCGHCGTGLGSGCPHCGFESPPGFAFCGKCGAALTGQPPASTHSFLAPQPQTPFTYTPHHLAEKILTSRRTLEGERKQVTVLFADLKGSMELLAERDPEEARQLLDPVLERLMAAVHRFEGTVNQVLGDGIMALFGAPIAHEDHALRACYAALAMQEAIQRYSAQVRRAHGIEIQIRVGLNSGEVVVRAIGNDLHMDYSAIGQTTHLAARMEQLATPGSIRLTASTLRLVEGLVRVTALGPIPVRGLAEPVEMFELVGASGIRRRLQAAVVRGLTRFVGRETEIETLRHALARAGAGHGQVVAVVGEAGVGKSRLAYEFVHSHHTQGWLVLESASVSYGKATPYFPIIDLLKRYAHVEDEDEPRAIRAKVTGQVLTLDETLQETLPALLALLDVLPADSPFQQLEPPQRRQRTLEALKRVLLRESQVQPLLLVFEDLHWIDTETQALLETLLESLPTARLMLLVNYRPEYQHGWGSKTYYTQLRLDPLPPASAADVLQALLGDDPSLAPLTPLLIARTEGNPFFLEESVRTLVETSLLAGEPGAYRLGQPFEHIQVPATVQAVLAARIDRLPPEEKWLLQIAAAIGTDVPFPLLQAIAELPEATLHRSLAHMQAAEFLYETSLFPERVYTFKHALTHEVAYSSLLQERRRLLHARIVAALEQRHADRLAEVASGAQGLPAGRQDPDQVEPLALHAFRGAVWDKAVTYGQQAGARAFEHAAFRQAATYYEQALAALEHLPDTLDTRGLAMDLRLGLARPLEVLGEYERERVLLREAEALARARDDRVRLARVLGRLAYMLRQRADHAGAVTAGQQALTLATACSDCALQVEASFFLGAVYWSIGDYGQAAELFRRNVATLEPRTGRPAPLLIHSRAWLAYTLSQLGQFAEGRRQGEEALRRATAEGRGGEPMIAPLGLGRLYLAQGDLEAAIRLLDQGLALCRAADNWNIGRAAAAVLGYACALAGRLAEGRALLEEALRESHRIGALQGQSFYVAQLSAVCLLAGRVDEAGQHAHQALALARQLGERGFEAEALYQLGAVHAQADPPEVAQSEARYREALALAEELGMRPLQAHCHHGLGTLYARSGQRGQAHAALATAIDLYRAMEMTFWLPQAEATLAQVEQQEGP